MEYIIVWIMLIMQPAQYNSVMGEVSYPAYNIYYETRELCRTDIEFNDMELNDGEYLLCLSTRLYTEAE